MPLSLGTRIGPYEIGAPLGAGGMGEVYRARDTKLGREVAIKVLPAALANDADYLVRFQREARVLAALNHPGIATILGLEEDAIVMELVEGQTMAERIAAGPIPPDEALPLAVQIAEALEAAHDKGIVHRDLKPANIKITPEGAVKVLDFGLAKSSDAGAAAAATGANSPTLTIRATQAGMIMGTAGYMSPEQAAGKPVDRRADIWAFGVVLWEMLAGRSLFEGETVSHTLADVLRAPIDLAALPSTTPREIRELVGRCLDRGIKTRLRDIGEARIAIQKCIANPAPLETPLPAAAPPRRMAWMPWAAAAAFAIGAAAGWWRATRPVPPPALVRATVELSPDLPLVTDQRSYSPLALSPDGKRLAVVLTNPSGKPQIYTRLLSQNQLTALPGTEDAGSPVFSPDGQWLAFVAGQTLKKVAMEGGAMVTLSPNTRVIRGLSWGDDGFIVAGHNAGSTALQRFPATGGAPSQILKMKDSERTQRTPWVLPGSRAILFAASEKLLSFTDGDIDVVVAGTGERRSVIPNGGSAPRYIRTPGGAGYLLYQYGNTLMAAPFDAKTLRCTGPPVPILEDLHSANTGSTYAISASGTLAYVAGGTAGRQDNIYTQEPSAKPQTVQANPGRYVHPKFSPDGKRLVFSAETTSSSDLWIKDLERETLSKLTNLPGENNYPVWAPDGKVILFRSVGHAGQGLYWMPADGSGEPQRLSDGTALEVPFAISLDGHLAYFGHDSKDATGNTHIFTVPIEGPPDHPKLGKAERLDTSTVTEFQPVFSPDGRWIAYTAVEPAGQEVYVRPFPGPGGRWRIGAGSYPIFTKTPGQLYFLATVGRVMAASYTVKGEAFSATEPRLWFEGPMRRYGTSVYDISPDGKRIVAIAPPANVPAEKPVTHLTFLFHFFEELERRVAAGAGTGAGERN